MTNIELKDEENFQRLGDLYSNFSDPLRLKILYLLFKENKMCVSDIVKKLNASQSNISHHLAILRANNLIGFVKDGKQVNYFLKDEHVILIMKMGIEHILERKED